MTPSSPKKTRTPCTPRSPHAKSFNSFASTPIGGAQSPSQRKSKGQSTDRFIPDRNAIDLADAHHFLTSPLDGENAQIAGRGCDKANKNELADALRTVLFTPDSPKRVSMGHEAISPRILRFGQDSDDASGRENRRDLLTVNHENHNFLRESSSPSRPITTGPVRVLDAPEIVDDYYLNLIAWSSSNLLAVALGRSVYIWNAATNGVQMLCQLGDDDIVTAVAWMNSTSGNDILAVGCNSAAVNLWDVSANKLVRSVTHHNARVSSLGFNPTTPHLLSSGSRDSIIYNSDIRCENSRASAFVGHRQEVCGLRWNPDGKTLASGGNENYLCIWDVKMGARGSLMSAGQQQPRLVLNDHTAAVKALAWAPFQGSLLASGGGTADRTIKFWNVNTGAKLNSIDTGSQVCALLWSPHRRELVSSHGFSQNQLVLWKYPSMTRMKEFPGHTSRVLHLDMSPDGATIVSAAADETLRFWNIFGPPSHRGRMSSHFLSGNRSSNLMTLR